ncbi:hypothetical protein, partial [Klebsiella pneumoniae]
MEDNPSGPLAIRVEHGGHAILVRPVQQPFANVRGELPSSSLRRAQDLHQQGVTHARQDRWRQALRAFN